MIISFIHLVHCVVSILHFSTWVMNALVCILSRQMTDPPDEIKRNGVKTMMYLRDKLRSSQGYYTMKLMLVGRAEQGKTTLMHRLMRDYAYNTNSPTNGNISFLNVLTHAQLLMSRAISQDDCPVCYLFLNSFRRYPFCSRTYEERCA